MLLFRGEEHIDRWCKEWSQPRGATLTIAQGWQLALAWYRQKMDRGWRRPTLEETEALLVQLGLSGEFWSLR
ncbi:MAG TPA: hypothetical protein VH157_09340 [Bryobacteraceae bacterium]|jgi:hypothetical protein|nr:hypothetical protein [Bryobacteraceae bacterium]